MTNFSEEVLKAAEEIIKQRTRKGGMATLKKYGKQHMRDLVNKRWAKHRKKKI